MINYTGHFKVIQDIVDWINNFVPGGSGANPPDWDQTHTYYIDEYVKKDDKTYKANTTISSGTAWNSAYWDEITDEFDEFYQTKPGRITSMYTKGEIFNKYSGKGKNVASGDYSHAEGSGTTASGGYSHAEGYGTSASGNYSHVEGYYSGVSGLYSHAEGYNTRAYGYYSHAEGSSSQTGTETGSVYSYGYQSHAEGSGSKAYGNVCHAEGYETQAGKIDSTVYYAHAEGHTTKAQGYCSHAEGAYTQATGQYTHTEGYSTKAPVDYGHAEGNGSEANGYCSHAEGSTCKTASYCSHIEGNYNTIDSGSANSHSEGTQNQTIAAGCSHVEGYGNKVYGYCAHVEGNGCSGYGEYSHCGGNYSKIGEEDSPESTYSSCFAHGHYVKVTNAQEIGFGKFNLNKNTRKYINAYDDTQTYAAGAKVKHGDDGIVYECNTDGTTGTWDSSKWNDSGQRYELIGTVFTIGNGNYDGDRNNLFEIDEDGSGYLNNEQLLALNPPTTDGTYTLQVTVTNGIPVFSWV